MRPRLPSHADARQPRLLLYYIFYVRTSCPTSHLLLLLRDNAEHSTTRAVAPVVLADVTALLYDIGQGSVMRQLYAAGIIEFGIIEYCYPFSRELIISQQEDI